MTCFRLFTHCFGQHWKKVARMCLAAIRTYYLFEHILFKKLSKALVAMVIANVPVFDFSFHLAK